ncbi:MAG: hypothetical protein NT070_04370 [Cyanobacteria bacterium]|nr:hypothetical protein [Cyanobacteriota bacterium]
MDGGAGNQEWFYILAGQWRSGKSDPTRAAILILKHLYYKQGFCSF